MTDESATVQREEKEKIMVLRNLFDFQISEISGNLETNFSIANISTKVITTFEINHDFLIKISVIYKAGLKNADVIPLNQSYCFTCM